MPTDRVGAEQAALDAEDAEIELRRIAELHVECEVLREQVRWLAKELREKKRRLVEAGWDRQHRLDQAAKKRVKDRDRRIAAAIQALREGVKGGKGL